MAGRLLSKLAQAAPTVTLYLVPVRAHVAIVTVYHHAHFSIAMVIRRHAHKRLRWLQWRVVLGAVGDMGEECLSWANADWKNKWCLFTHRIMLWDLWRSYWTPCTWTSLLMCTATWLAAGRPGSGWALLTKLSPSLSLSLAVRLFSQTVTGSHHFQAGCVPWVW